LIETSETPSLPFEAAGLVSRGKGEPASPRQGLEFPLLLLQNAAGSSSAFSFIIFD
jgi:hypothetical protein